MVRKLTETAVPTSDHRLADAVERLGRLPVLSATVRRVRLIAASEDAGIGDLVAALEADQGLAADLLRCANSAASATDEDDTLSLVLWQADEALYETKRAGRGRVVRY